MPKSDSQKMVEIKFSISEKLLKEMLELAEAEGWSPSVLHRMIWAIGFNSFADDSYRRRMSKLELDELRGRAEDPVE